MNSVIGTTESEKFTTDAEGFFRAFLKSRDGIETVVKQLWCTCNSNCFR